MNTSRILPFILVILLAACAGQDKAPTSEDTAGSAPNNTPVAAPTSDAAQTPSQPNVTSVAVSDPNPAHGEPGHRCEIAVGASLSSAPPAGSTPAVMPATQQITMPATNSPTPNQGSTAPGMNPPHGEPGHDCAVPVGSPLPK